MGTSAPSAMKDDIEQGPREDTKEASSHKLIKYTALVLLVVQNASVIILTRVIKQSNGAPFLATVAVLTAEIIKFALCGSVLLYQNKHAVLNPCGTARALLAQHGAATLKCGVPALCYTVQNYLVYFSLANLEIVVFQLMYQSKLLIAAPFSILILKKQLSAQNWLALLALFTGLVIVNLSSEDAPATPGVVKNFSLGCLGALLGSSLSAFAGVYFEALLKGASVSLWARNVQLCLFTVPLSLISAYLEGGLLAHSRIPRGVHPYSLVCGATTSMRRDARRSLPQIRRQHHQELRIQRRHHTWRARLRRRVQFPTHSRLFRGRHHRARCSACVRPQVVPVHIRQVGLKRLRGRVVGAGARA